MIWAQEICNAQAIPMQNHPTWINLLSKASALKEPTWLGPGVPQADLGL
jgi:hypothetical protein